MTTLVVLQLDHHFRKPLRSHFVFDFLFPTLTNLEVLAVGTTQVAVAKENVSHAVCPHKRWLFTKMRAIRTHNRIASGVTTSDLSCSPIHMTVERTNSAIGKQHHQFFYAYRQFAAGKQIKIARRINRTQDIPTGLEVILQSETTKTRKKNTHRPDGSHW
jgi:hypothetical protein